jgi:hypothetical protein
LAFWEIVDASRAPEDAELADVIDGMGQPRTLTLNQLAKERAPGALSAARAKSRGNRPGQCSDVKFFTGPRSSPFFIM